MIIANFELLEIAHFFMELKNLEIVANGDQLQALKEILQLFPLYSNKEGEALMKALPLVITLDDAYQKTMKLDDMESNPLTPDEEISSLKQTIKKLEWRIATLRVRDMINGQQAQLLGAKAASVIADMMLIPDTIMVHCTKSNYGYEYNLNIRDVIAIKAKGKVKQIYIRNNVSDGDCLDTVETNMDFDDLLALIQKRPLLLHMVSRSFAINILEYKLAPPGSFKLNEELATRLTGDLRYKLLLTIKAHSKFDKCAYDNCIFEIRHYINYVKIYGGVDEQLNFLSRYKNSLVV